jgi:hypothetical protein
LVGTLGPTLRGIFSGDAEHDWNLRAEWLRMCQCSAFFIINGVFIGLVTTGFDSANVFCLIGDF